MRFRTVTPHKSSPSYMTLAKISKITKFSKTYIHYQLKYYFVEQDKLGRKSIIVTRSGRKSK